MFPLILISATCPLSLTTSISRELLLISVVTRPHATPRQIADRDSDREATEAVSAARQKLRLWPRFLMYTLAFVVTQVPVR